MTVLVFGTSGQVGSELQNQSGTLNLSRADADLTDPASCQRAILANTPTAVINAAAYTNVDAAETDEARATCINAHAPRAMAETCAALNIPFVHLSTDYVFDGAGRDPWQPDAAVAPLNAYGRSKALGEHMVRAVGGTHVILRTSWVVSAQGSNFVKTMRALGAAHESLTVISDQIGGLTPARDIASACLKVANTLITAPEKSGTYHFSGTPDASWADVARAVQSETNQSCAIIDCPSADYPTVAQRPLNSRLDCASFEEIFTISRPNWRIGLKDILEELGSTP